MQFLSLIMAASFAATAIACDAANCCYKNQLTCYKHNVFANTITANAFCKDKKTCDESIRKNCDADCCRIIAFPAKSYGVKC
ncbi:hypothetical protein EJ02DRAFT_459484 [Clathrospora elynae]|uniref:Extracellular membrane protein CFEM domain-containing protein n=1 Tax=Clathrospora elynae TaxID=706981 RepID=A0A6A5SAI7_9PLEO|nr:hypothetical protein EJ02DRAFT_459484 [Clathrospora elynae]